jgi:hypothetical protein
MSRLGQVLVCLAVHATNRPITWPTVHVFAHAFSGVRM